MTESVRPARAPRHSLLPGSEERAQRRKWRRYRDAMSRWGISAAGFGVVLSLTMIFVYLFYEVAPVFRGANITPDTTYQAPGLSEESTVSHLVMERYATLGINYASDGQITFFEIDDGDVRESLRVPHSDTANVTAFAKAEDNAQLTAYGFDDGRAVVMRHDFETSFPNDQRYLTPVLEFPFGEEAIEVMPEGAGIDLLAVQQSDRGSSRLGVVGYNARQGMHYTHMTARENLLTGAVSLQRDRVELPPLPDDAVPTGIKLEKTLRYLFVSDDRGYVHFYNVDDRDNPVLVQSTQASDGGAITAMDFLVGTVSLIVGTAEGKVSQWFLVRDDNNDRTLEFIRGFEAHDSAVTRVVPEFNRKGFFTGDENGNLSIHYATSSRTLLRRDMADSALVNMAISPRDDWLLTATANGNITSSALRNEHPEMSLKALWGKVWYEGRGEPYFVWQSSSGSDEFEPKFSLIPLTLGTIKAAFYAMIFAMPLGLLGAVYTAYFMSPKLRGMIKPTIEIMEALPTVVLGFLAGLWLAPFMENNLPAVFSIILLTPFGILATAALWRFVPEQLRDRVPPGWEVAILIPVVVGIGWWAVSVSPVIEVAVFDGSMRQWFTEIGITYDQRNALVVGLAMGFAVIPTIYSIAEDAIFNVPLHLTQGSLALGATPWQTMMGVVLPTASPGMFSALMIGMGRAVGETMIVLMATGNSPVVNFNIFEGMRTLSANIAVELPETAVGSSHFRVLFIAALVLFIMTFVLNTVAEVVRQRLRRRYSSL